VIDADSWGIEEPKPAVNNAQSEIASFATDKEPFVEKTSNFKDPPSVSASAFTEVIGLKL
jgi:hypothetical protein